MSKITNVLARRAVAAAALFLVSAGAGLATTLEVLTLGSPGKEFEEWGTVFTVSAPQSFTFRWSPTVAGATGADWEVTTTNAMNVTVSVAKGTLAQALAVGQRAFFNAGSFLPASPPAAAHKYYVRVTAHDSQGKPLGAPSAPVSITYQPPGPAIHFDDDLGGKPVGFSDPGHPEIRFIRYDPLTETDPGKLELEVYNDGAKATDPVQVRIADGHLVVRQDGATIPVPSLKHNERKFITFTLRPQLTVGQPTVEGNWDQWRARYGKGFRILAGSAKNGSPYVQWQQPTIAGRSSSIVCGFAPESATAALAKIRHCVEDRMRALMTGDGVKGFLLKRVGGPVLATQNADTVFEPASAIKIIINFAAFKLMAAIPKTFNFDTQVSWFQDFEKDGDGKDTSCPADTGKATESLKTSLSQMMMASDNRRTQALRTFIGQTQINALAHSIGMTNTIYQHRDGCGSDAIAHPNRLTLNEAAKLYGGVADGSLLPTNRASFYSVMAGGGAAGSSLQTIAKQEAPDGMPDAKVQSFIKAMADHFKPGSYSLNTGENRTVAGSITIPFRVGDKVEPRDFAYGAFIVNATNGDKAAAAYTVSNEISREQIHEALLHW